MALLEKLGPTPNLTALMAHLFDEGFLRETAVAHSITVPGFRPGQSPISLTVRAIARASATDRRLRTHLDAELVRLAERERPHLTGAEDDEAVAAVDGLVDLPRARAVGTLLAALDDNRAPVREAAGRTLTALESGDVQLAAPSRPRPDRRTSAAPAPRNDPRQLRSLLADRDRQLRMLRSESTAQEQRIGRLRSQLEAEKEAHQRTRDAASGKPAPRSRGADDDTARELARVQKDVHRLRSEQMKTKVALDAALRDYSLLATGVQELEELVNHVLESRPASSTPITPRKPKAPSALSVEAKLRLPSSEHHWPRHFRAFLERLAGSPWIERLQPLDFSRATRSRISAMIPESTLIGQYSDGDRAARFLIATTATGEPELLWIREELAEQFFPGE